VSFVDRTYPDIVRDGLTTLTQGVAREVHRVSYDASARPVRVPDIVLRRRPVQRVSFVSGQVENSAGERIPYTFSLGDYELVPNSDDPRDFNTLRFLPFGRRPAPDSDVVVNYYPRTADPTVVTDLNVGSVVRTLVEVVSREFGLLYQKLNLAYDSAFLETAEGASLDRVVALLGYRRFRAGRPAGTVRFGRRAGSQGLIAILAGTPVTDAQDKIRYETIETHTMLPGESTAEVRVRGAAAATPPVQAGVLSVVQRVIAGIESVTNERPTTRATEDESDEELRARVRVALQASNKGTVGALREGLLQLPDVRDVGVIEMPNGVPGEVQLQISLNEPSATLPPAVATRIEELRPAGIRVIAGPARNQELASHVALVLAGSQQPPALIESVHDAVRSTLARQVARAGVGRPVRVGALVAAVLGDERVVDATLSVGPKGGAPATPGTDYVPEDDVSVTLAEQDVSFAPDTFDEPPATHGQNVPVEVRAVIPVTLLQGVLIDAVKAQVTSLLQAFLSRLTPGTPVDTAAVLTALRDDTKYGIDAGRLELTLVAEDQFVQVIQGGPAFQVLPRHLFTVVSVEVTA